MRIKKKKVKKKVLLGLSQISHLVQAVHEVADERLHLINSPLLQLQRVHCSDKALRLREKESRYEPIIKQHFIPII